MWSNVIKRLKNLTVHTRNMLKMFALFRNVVLFLLFYLATFSNAQKPRPYSEATRCLTPDNKVGKCVIIWDCKELLYLLETRSKDPKTVQFLRSSQCGNAGNQPKVCCNAGINYNLNNTYVKENLPQGKNCGIPEVVPRIIGGNAVQLGEYPWMAALGYRKINSNSATNPHWICGGSLISTRFVLTAAHCLSGISPWEIFVVRLGDVNLDENVQDDVAPLNVFVERTIIHEKYSSSPVTHDIGLVKLKSEVYFTTYIKPVCLPMASELRRNSLTKQIGIVAGWGRTSFSGSFSPILRDLPIPILDVNVCKEAYKTIFRSNIDYKNVCAGFIEGHKDSCQGDSGGPLVWLNSRDTQYYVVGIVSYGYKCAEPGFPGIYTRVSEYVDWISFHVNS